MKRLCDISEISMGATPAPEGAGFAYLRLGNVAAGQIIGEPVDGAPPIKGLDARLQVDDILVRGRGPDLSAAVVGEGQAGSFPTIELFVVRVNREIAEPAYVVAYINEDHVQAELAQGSQGTGFARLNRPTLANLEIQLPPMAEQRMIGSLALEARREQTILKEIAERKRLLHSELLRQAMERAHAGDGNPRHGLNPGLIDAVTSSALPSVPKQKVHIK